MLFLYNFGIFLYGLLVKVFSLFNPKAKLFIQGRQQIFSLIDKKIDSTQRNVWFHFASLGEFEQGRPLLEKINAQYPEKPIVITFFSPSGYEIRKDYPLAAGVFYLPLDTKANAEKFIRMINPEIAVFTKYEFWYHYFKTLKARNTPLFLISGIFRPEQAFFKWYGRFYREMLNCVLHFFVQNDESKKLLNSINIKQVSLSGDTRFDRVFENMGQAKPLPLVSAFTGAAKVLIAGSTWPQDENLIKNLVAKHPGWKLILAPHEIGKSHIDQIKALFPDSVKYSALVEGTVPAAQVLIIDNIGLLSSLYQYGDIAYIGGGFGAGIHNTLEAAAFGLPLIFGPRYQKFQEAKDLIELQAAISINDSSDLEAAFQKLSVNPVGLQARDYVFRKKGATEQIVSALRPYLA